MTAFHEVTGAWDRALPEQIHPAREHVSETAYWQSGVEQATHAAGFIPEGGTVMDFGCGDGRVTLPLARMGFHVLAVDASANMLKRLSHNIDTRLDEEAESRIHMIRSNGFDLHVSDVDTIVSRSVLIHHEHSDVADLVTALVKVLKTGGHFVADWPTGVHHVRRDWIDVTTFEVEHRAQVADDAGLILVADGKPSVWVKR